MRILARLFPSNEIKRCIRELEDFQKELSNLDDCENNSWIMIDFQSIIKDKVKNYLFKNAKSISNQINNGETTASTATFTIIFVVSKNFACCKFDWDVSRRAGEIIASFSVKRLTETGAITEETQHKLLMALKNEIRTTGSW